MKNFNDVSYFASMVNKDDKYDIYSIEIEDLIDESKKYFVDEQIMTSVVSGHGVIWLSKFIKVPKNTLIVTFVTEGMVHKDYEGGVDDSTCTTRRITAMNYLYI